MTPVVFGTPEGIRTLDLRIRSPLLYPAELLAHEDQHRLHAGAGLLRSAFGADNR